MRKRSSPISPILRWNLRYRGWLELVDLREILRNPLVPTGRADVHGEGTFADKQFHGTGIYAGRDIALPYDDFHAKGLTSHGTFTINNDGLVVPDFYAGALGGTVKGRVTLQFAGLKFRAETHVQDVRLASLLPSIEHHGFPIDELHWDADLTADTKEEWTRRVRTLRNCRQDALGASGKRRCSPRSG